MKQNNDPDIQKYIKLVTLASYSSSCRKLEYWRSWIIASASLSIYIYIYIYIQDQHAAISIIIVWEGGVVGLRCFTDDRPDQLKGASDAIVTCRVSNMIFRNGIDSCRIIWFLLSSDFGYL